MTDITIADIHEMNDDQWFETFEPIANPNGNGGYIVDDVCYIFETCNPEDMEKIKAADPACVWTMMDAEDDSDDSDDDDDDRDEDEDKDSTVIYSGFSHVNAIGYFITKKPFTGEHMMVTFD